jgi:hypothetical protein
VGRGQTGEPEQREPLGQPGDGRVLAQARAGRREPAGGIGHGDARGQPPPQLALPDRAGRQRVARSVGVLPARPGREHLGPLHRVAVEQAREVADRAEATGAAGGVRRRGAHVLGQARQPRLAHARVDDLEQGPDRPLRQPRIGVGRDPRRRRERLADQLPGRREGDVGAHAVGPAGRRAEARRHPLRQPTLHSARGHGHDVGSEGVGRRLGEQPPQRGDQPVGPFGSVDVQHAGGSARLGGRHHHCGRRPAARSDVHPHGGIEVRRCRVPARRRWATAAGRPARYSCEPRP